MFSPLCECTGTSSWETRQGDKKTKGDWGVIKGVGGERKGKKERKMRGANIYHDCKKKTNMHIKCYYIKILQNTQKFPYN